MEQPSRTLGQFSWKVNDPKLDCRPANKEFFACKVCERMRPKEEYDHAQWRHCLQQNATCKGCCHPTCTNPKCKACTTCCNAQCKAKHCTKVFPGKVQLPRNAEELTSWKCPSCIHACCQVCGTVNHNAKRHSQRVQTQSRWTYAQCMQAQLQKSNKKHQ